MAENTKGIGVGFDGSGTGEVRNLRTEVRDDNHENLPGSLDSPNTPRNTLRPQGYSNPILGDEGQGKIGRGGIVGLNKLEKAINHIIENYVRDKEWYKDVRGREALWNMYKRLEWWAKEQEDNSQTETKQVLSFIKECIHKILNASASPDSPLPTCPLPTEKHYDADYFNHFEEDDLELITFSMNDEPWDDLPDSLYFLSSLENQEWEAVFMDGEKVLKYPFDKLCHSEKAKATLFWKLKFQSKLRFKYRVESSNGNSLAFAVNNEVVHNFRGNNNDEWQEVEVALPGGGQKYKFDWLVRKQGMDTPESNANAVLIKDIEAVEIIKDGDMLQVAQIGKHDYGFRGEWAMIPEESVVRADLSPYFRPQYIGYDLFFIEVEPRFTVQFLTNE